ncbi:alginate O-acetyltransferase [Pseudolabrys sp. Root1462]|uniref:MBOAT family O-acyltransferase n=1 Tax=Pseudolabrys sp. Root1462 TaxID=1736466 RepID=UPI00070286F7|nr:MBOAT family protein [Pseudolabrys sp. Root1462]KQZ01900.1 alginate O-acetyltransferase [Pseudolabrys sp. Root1462]
MLFTQYNFIFLYLPITLIGYFVIARLARNPLYQITWLAGASLVFYGVWNVKFVPIIAVSIIFNYLMGFRMAHLPPGSVARKRAFLVAIVANLAALAFFKYTNFGIDTLNHLTGLHVQFAKIALPLGISFFTFTQIAYLVDVYSGYPNERNFSKYVLFVTYFPHLIAGPILHHSEMMPQFGAEENRRFSVERFAIGLTIFAIGMFKKAVIADGLALLADPVFTNASKGAVTSGDAWVGVLSYSLQIYFDFSGYSDMAIGLSTMFRIKLPFNFDSPYKAQSIVEFWRRWHISLSRFLRDYLYIPLGGNRHGAAMRNFNLAVTMLLGGLWHGAGWTFVVWGGLHGVYLVINHYWTRTFNRVPVLKSLSKTFVYALCSLVITQLAVVVAWVFFRADSFSAAKRLLAAMFSFGAFDWRSTSAIGGTYCAVAIAVGYAICILMPNIIDMFQPQQRVGLEIYENPRPFSLARFGWSPSVIWAITTTLLLSAGLIATLVAGGISPFLYFQF